MHWILFIYLPNMLNLFRWLATDNKKDAVKRGRLIRLKKNICLTGKPIVSVINILSDKNKIFKLYFNLQKIIFIGLDTEPIFKTQDFTCLIKSV